MLSTGLFGSINGDRKYTELDYKRPFTRLFTDGVLNIDASNLQIVSGENMQVKIKPGFAMIDGYNIDLVDEDYPVDIEDADGVFSRIDRIVVRLDYLGRKIGFAYLKGVAETNPTAPPKLREEGTFFDLSLATIFVNVGATEITQANITDTRYFSEECGIIQPANKMVLDTLFAQYQAEWERFKTSLSEDDVVTMILTDEIARQRLQKIMLRQPLSNNFKFN